MQEYSYPYGPSVRQAYRYCPRCGESILGLDMAAEVGGWTLCFRELIDEDTDTRNAVLRGSRVDRLEDVPVQEEQETWRVNGSARSAEAGPPPRLYQTTTCAGSAIRYGTGEALRRLLRRYLLRQRTT